MHCPHCGTEHQANTPCEREQKTQNANTYRPEERHPLAGLDNPFWKSEEPAA